MKLNNIVNLFSILFVCLLFSCNSDMDCLIEDLEGNEDKPVMTFKMALDVTKSNFDDGSTSPKDQRSATYQWLDGDMLYMKFLTDNGFIKGDATYKTSEQKWYVRVFGSLKLYAQNKVEVTFFKKSPKAKGDIIALSNNTAVYQDATGFYNLIQEDTLLLSAHLQPATSCIRFKGTPDKLIEVDGLEYFTSFNTSNGTFTKSSDCISTRVSSDGYTDYIYGVLSNTEKPQIAISHNIEEETYQFTANCNSKMLQIGKSGWMDIPTPNQAKGWQVEKLEHGWVDMGLSVKWATCNVGASTPELFGEYFPWGTTTPKETKGSGKDISGEPQYDAATALWGGLWRTPTKEELQELIENTTCTETTVKGVAGCRLTSKITGQSIFLPAAKPQWSHRKDNTNTTDILGVDLVSGAYWSSTSTKENDEQAYYLDYKNGNVSINSLSILYGLCVRPVRINNEKFHVIEVTTGEAQNVTSQSADIKAFFVNILQKAVYGIEYIYYLGNQEIKKEKHASVNQDGEVIIPLTNLYENGNYSYRAFAKWNGKSAYGEFKEFKTKKAGYVAPWVDLGLSVKWATCNIGAQSAEQFGDYYAWGEIYTKVSYGEDNCITYGLMLGDISGNELYDVARSKLGESWRIPTKEEWTELIDNCTSTWTTKKGVSGRLLTSKINKESIFLPAAGFWTGSTFIEGGGFYNSSTPVEGKTTLSYFMHFTSNVISNDKDLRSYGFSVRPVTGGKTINH